MIALDYFVVVIENLGFGDLSHVYVILSRIRAISRFGFFVLFSYLRRMRFNLYLKPLVSNKLELSRE